MNIQGLQKLTLLDFPGKMACTVFTAGCNLRCPFCHNSSLVVNFLDKTIYTIDDILAFLNRRKGILDGVAITGGEPLLQPDIEDFIINVRALGFALKLDTNGSFPDRLRSLIDNNLVDYVAMDVKSSEKGYPNCVGTDNFDIEKIKESVEFLKQGRVDYEFRTTVVDGLHTEEDIEDLGRWLTGAKRHYLQAFRDSGNVIGSGFSAFSKERMLAMRDIMLKYVPECEIRGL